MARVLISMKDEFLEQVDKVAESEQRTRSELIREALRIYIRRRSASMQGGRLDQDIQTIEKLLD